MKKIINVKFAVALTILLCVPFVAGMYVEKASAQDNNEQAQVQKKDDSEQTSFKYVAQPGDSYTLMARKAIQTYGINNKVDLSKAQIIFAETMLTQNAGSPELNEGQSVAIKESDVKNQIEAAKKLSEEQEEAWGKYTVGVDFNTDKVGEAKA